MQLYTYVSISFLLFPYFLYLIRLLLFLVLPALLNHPSCGLSNGSTRELIITSGSSLYVSVWFSLNI